MINSYKLQILILLFFIIDYNNDNDDNNDQSITNSNIDEKNEN